MTDASLNGAAYESSSVPGREPRPKALALKPEGLPAELIARAAYVNWNYVKLKDKATGKAKLTKTGATRYTKVPCRPDGGPADTTNSKTWSTFAECHAAYGQGRFDGVGFVASPDDPYTLIDLDHVFDRGTGAVEAWAQPILETATKEGAYIELSPSGTGIHIFGKGPKKFEGRKANDAEMYCQDRYFTMTGWALSGTKAIGRIKKTVELVRARIDMRKAKERPPTKPSPSVVGKRPYAASLTDDQILEQYAFPSANGGRLRKLLSGDTGDYPSGSEADLAAASDLAFWFWNCPVKIEEVMRNSGLMRDKWNENKSYLARTIAKALAERVDYYGKPEERPMMPDPPEPKPKNKKPKEPADDSAPDPKVFNYRDHMRTVQDLLDNPPPPIDFLLPDWLAVGHSSLLVGRPKGFKSTLAAQILLALTGNKDLLSDWALFGGITRKYRAALIDYEQSEQKAAELFGRFGKPCAPGLLRINTFPKMDADGVAQLRYLIIEEKLSLVIIDSLTRIAPQPARGKSAFEAQADLMQGITDMAHETGAHVLTIAHQGKRDAADDPMLAIAGTNALAASVDDIAVLFKEGDDTPGSIQRKLFISGRNVSKPGTYMLEMLAGESRFVLKGSEDAFVQGEVRRMILGLLGGGATMTPNDLAKSLGRDRGQMHRALRTLVENKLIVALDKGRYTSRTTEAAREFRKNAERGKK